MPRSIEALKNDRKVIRVSLCLHKEIDAFLFSGPEQFSADARLILLFFTRISFRRRFDRFRCLDRSKRSRRSKINYTVSFRFIQTRSYILQPPPHRSQRYSLHFNSFSLFSIVLCLFLFFFSLSLFSFSLFLSLPFLSLCLTWGQSLKARWSRAKKLVFVVL